MIKEFIGTGKTIEEATQNAKLQLNAPETADVHVEIITMPEKKKFFGLIGGCDAKVKVSYDDGKKEKKPEAPKKSVEKKASAPKKPAQKKQEVKEKPVQAPKADKPEEKISEKDIDLDYACAYLKTMIEGLKVENPKITAKVADGTVEMNIECEDYGIIIGRRGETLDSLQYLTSLAIKNVTNKYVRVTLNVGDYRAKREETLKALATKNANYVARSGRRYSFEPMNPYERRIIHSALQSAFDAKGDFLVPFRTWRNTMTEEAADALLLQKHLLMLTERRRLTELTFQSSVKFRLIRITTDNQS